MIGQLDWIGENPGIWLAFAVAGWALALALAAFAANTGRRRPPVSEASPSRAVPGPDAEQHPPGPPPVADAGVGGVLRWLYHGAEADAVACLEMRPGEGERLRVEPRGLPGDVVAELTRHARDALLGTGPERRQDAVTLRWLGVGGPRSLVALRATADDAPEALRFGRYLIEWVITAGMDEPALDLEDRLGTIPGVAWAEVAGPSGEVRVVVSEGADRAAIGAEVERRLGSDGVRISWVDVAETAPPEPHVEPPAPVRASRVGAVELAEPRVRLVEVAFSENGRATADVRVTWKDRELRGRGHAHASPAGPYYAGAKAVADALRPLLDSEVVVEGLYQASTDQAVPVLIADVRFEGEHLVGAVVDRNGEAPWAGARAVLDAVNRRLVQVAGRSGRI